MVDVRFMEGCSTDESASTAKSNDVSKQILCIANIWGAALSRRTSVVRFDTMEVRRVKSCFFVEYRALRRADAFDIKVGRHLRAVLHHLQGDAIFCATIYTTKLITVRIFILQTLIMVIFKVTTELLKKYSALLALSIKTAHPDFGNFKFFT